MRKDEVNQVVNVGVGPVLLKKLESFYIAKSKAVEDGYTNLLSKKVFFGGAAKDGSWLAQVAKENTRDSSLGDGSLGMDVFFLENGFANWLGLRPTRGPARVDGIAGETV